MARSLYEADWLQVSLAPYPSCSPGGVKYETVCKHATVIFQHPFKNMDFIHAKMTT